MYQNNMQPYQLCLPVYNVVEKYKRSAYTYRNPCKNNCIKPRTKFSTSFSPFTRIQLENGVITQIKDIKLGDVIKGGAVVNTIFKVRNTDHVPFYRILNKELNEYIYVTGCHFIREDGRFIRVRDSSYAELTDIVEDAFTCLITSTHHIPIGEHIFWDWSDFCQSCNDSCIPQEFFGRDRFNQL